MRLSRALLLLLVLPALPAGAQRVGNYTFTGNGKAPNLARPYTIIDLGSPVTTDGDIGAVAIRFSRASCDGGFKVKFYRRSGNTLTSVGERGPFAINGNHTTVQLSPAVSVRKNDLIGVVSLADCAEPLGQTPLLDAAAVQFAGDVNTASLSAGTTLPHFALAAYGAENTRAEIRTEVIVVAGAATGANNAQFRTDVFLTAPRQGIAGGRLVYHREARTGFDDDPSVPFDLEPGASRSFPNLIAANLGLAGKGSVDVYTTIGFEPPIAAARVYDDSGASGTKGFSYDAQRLDDALDVGERGLLFTPQDPVKFRMNIGIRTLDSPTEIDFTILNSAGVQRAVVTKQYPANYYVQPDSNSLLGTPIQPGDTIHVTPIDGPVFVYGSIIDNITNDPSLQLAKGLQ